MTQPNKVRSRLAALEVTLLVAGLLCWTTAPFLIANFASGPVGTFSFIVIPIGWMLIGGAVTAMVLRFAHWAVERVGDARDRLGL